jgi:hypothetical protein
MNDEPKTHSFINQIRPALIVALCVLLAPFIILASAYAEFKIAGTLYVEDACRMIGIHEPLSWLADAIQGDPPVR